MPPLLVLVPQKISLAATGGERKVCIVFSVVVVVDDPIPYSQQEQHSCLFGGHPFYFLHAPFL